jgi:hypothetical protein
MPTANLPGVPPKRALKNTWYIVNSSDDGIAMMMASVLSEPLSQTKRNTNGRRINASITMAQKRFQNPAYTLSPFNLIGKNAMLLSLHNSYLYTFQIYPLSNLASR